MQKQGGGMSLSDLPINVQRFLWLTYGGIVLQIPSIPFRPEDVAMGRELQSLFGRGDTGENIGLAANLLLGLLVIALVISVYWIVARYRKNWLRWTLACLFVIAVPLEVWEIWHRPPEQFIASTFDVIAYTMHAAGYYFVFTGDAGNWFRPEH
jgi:hypothetical protein